MDFRGEVLFWSKAMHERVGARTPYQRYACATASVFIAGAIVIGDAWMSLRRRWRLSRRDRAQNPVPRNVSSRALVLYSDPAYAAPLVDGDRYGRAITNVTSPGARQAAVHCLCRLLAEMSARQPFSSPAPMTVVTTLTADNFRVPDELFFYGVMGLPPNPPSPYLRLCHSSQFPPSTPPPGSILLNRGIDGSMVRPGRATAAPLSIRWLDIELEEEEEARRRERDARLAEEEEEARRRELDAMLSAGGGGGGTERGSSWAVHPEATAVEGGPRRWESTRARLAREAREAAAAVEAAAAAAAVEEEEEEEGAAGGEEEEEQEGASSAIRPETTADQGGQKAPP